MAEERDNIEKAISEFIKVENFLENINKLHTRKITLRHFIVKTQNLKEQKETVFIAARGIMTYFP